MKKIIMFVVLIFTLIFNLKADYISYQAFRLKSINDLCETATAIGADLNLGIIPYLAPIGMSQLISENFIPPAMDKPITVHMFIDSEDANYMPGEFDNAAWVFCIPYLSTKESVISALELKLINEEKQLYYCDYLSIFVVLKDGYAIISDLPNLCEATAEANAYDFKPTLEADTFIYTTSYQGFQNINVLPFDIDETEIEEEYKPFYEKMMSISKFIFDYVNAFEVSEIGIAYKKDYGLVIESKTFMDEKSEFSKPIASQTSFISIEEAVHINSTSLVSGIVKENKFEKYCIEKFISLFSLSQSEFDIIYAELIKGSDIVTAFPSLKEDGMNVKCYEVIKQFVNDALSVYDAMQEASFKIDITENNHFVLFEKVSYKNGFDVSPFEMVGYKSIIDLYDYTMEKAEYTPTTPFVTLTNPTAVSFNFKAVLNEIKKNSSESEIEEMDECLAVAKSVNITIPDSYTMQTFIDGKDTYSYMAPEVMNIAQVKNKLNETKSNEFIRMTMENMTDNKIVSVMHISPAMLYNKFYNIVATFDGEEELKKMGLTPCKESDGIVFINGFTKDNDIYESCVIGKEILYPFVNAITLSLYNGIKNELK